MSVWVLGSQMGRPCKASLFLLASANVLSCTVHVYCFLRGVFLGAPVPPDLPSFRVSTLLLLSSLLCCSLTLSNLLSPGSPTRLGVPSAPCHSPWLTGA